MRAFHVAAIAPLAITAALVAGCGGSSSSGSSSASAGGYGPATTAAASTSKPAQTVQVSTDKSKFGTILAAGPDHTAVYLFEADHGDMSACSGACAAAWPPVIGTATASGAAHSTDLGTIKRADGTTQVTYKGHPLYWYVADKTQQDVNGQGLNQFGAEWYVLAPSGTKVDDDKGDSDAS